MKKFLTFCVIAFSLSACPFQNDYDREGAKRVQQEWETKLETLPIGASSAELSQWLKQNGLLKNDENPTFGEKYQNINLPNGHFSVRPHWYHINFCNGFFTVLTIHLDEQKRVSKKEMGLWGSCL